MLRQELKRVFKSRPALALSAAVLAILLTAPLGAFGIDLTCRRLLTKDGKASSDQCA